MENTMKNYEDVDSWKTIMFLYNSALKEVGTKLEILNDEFHPMVVIFSFAIAGMVEWIFHLSSPSGFVLMLVLAPLLYKE